MKVRILVLFLTSVTVLFAGGCSSAGGGSAATTSVLKPATANVAGNWLLAGSLPPQTLGSGSTQISVTLSTVGNHLVALGNVYVVCPTSVGALTIPIGYGSPFVSNADVADDGSFILPNSVVPPSGAAIPLVTISGSIPSSQGGTWDGSYKVTGPAFQGCNFDSSGTFVANPIALVTGTYVASGSLTQGAVVTPITLTMVLQQGAPETTSGGVVSDESFGIQGSLAITGTSCFQKGTLPPLGSTLPNGIPSGGATFGAELDLQFTMDDGSRLSDVPLIEDARALRLSSRQTLIVSDGSCATRAGTALQHGDFVRQP